jgi:autotransporter translocation and assembly factor TamB
MAERRPWQRVVRRIFGALALIAVFVAAAVVGVVLHLDVPPARRLAAFVATQGLSSVLTGRVEFVSFARVSLHRIRIAKAAVYDIHGHPVLTLSNADVDVDPVRLLQELRADTPTFTLIFPRVHAERAEAEIVADAKTGYPTIGDAFTPRPSDRPSTQPSTGRSVELALPRIEIVSGTLLTRLREVPLLEADLREVQGGLSVGPSGFATDVKRFDMVVRGYGTEARGRGTLSIHLPGASHASFDGVAGDIEVHAKGRAENGRVELSADAPGAAAAAVRRFLPGWPIREERATAHVEASGDFPELRASGNLAFGPAVVTFQGPLFIGGEPRATLAFSGKHVDLRSFLEGAPRTDVAVDGDVAAGSDNGTFSANVRAHTSETEVEGYPVPAVDAEATIRDGAVSGTATIHEPGLPTRAQFHVSSDGTVDVDADAKAVDLHRLRPFAKQRIAGGGGARLRAHLAKGNLTASLEAASDAVEVASVRISGARVSVEARGPIAEPEKLQAVAHVSAMSLEHGDGALEHVEVDVHGSLAAANFKAKATHGDSTNLVVGGVLSLSGHPLVRDAKLSLRHGNVLAEGEIAKLDPDHAKVDLRNVRVTGAGAPLTGSLRIDRDQIEVEAESEELDLGALSRTLNVRHPTLDGRARVSLALSSTKVAVRGRLRMTAVDLSLGPFSGISAHLSADLDGKRLTGEASGGLEKLGNFSATWDVETSGPALELASYRDATGKAELQLSDVRLSRLEALLPEDGPVEKLEGTAAMRLELSRASTRAMLPSAEMTAVTTGLAVMLRGTGEERGKRIEGVDLEAAGSFDAESGATSTTARLRDSHGELVALRATVGIDVPRLVREPGYLTSRLATLPIDVRASAPMRAIADLPVGLRIAGLSGDVGGHLGVHGTLARPELRAALDGRGIVVQNSNSPVDLHAEAQLDAGGSLYGSGEAKLAKKSLAKAVITGTLPGGDPSAFRGDVKLDLKGLPLELLGAYTKNNVRGHLFGTASFSTLETGGGALLADLEVGDALVGGAPLGKGKLHVATEGQRVNASVAFSGNQGSFDTNWKAGLKWTGLVPAFLTGVPVSGRIVAKNFSVAAASPLAAGVLSRLGGRIDANMTVTLILKHDDPGKRGMSLGGNIDGSAVLRDGTAIIDLLGVEVQNVGMSVRADGKANSTHIASVDIKGNLRGPGDNLRGSVDLDFEGLNLVRGGGALYANDTPLFFRGAQQGRVTGEVALRLKREAKRMVLNVDVPTLKLKLPESSSRKVLDVPDHPEIAVLQDAAPPEENESALPMSILVHLGKNVSLLRSDIELKVGGSPAIHLGKETKMSGSIELVPGGRLPVLGQVFVIDRGLVTFDTGVPDNPAIHVTASWRAPNNTLVLVEVTGRMQEVQVALRSEPPLPEREVFALLFGGASADPSASDRNTGEEGSAAKTVALQSTLQQLNGLLGQSAVELRVGSTSEARPRYTAAVRVREDLWFEASTYQQSQTANDPSSYRSVVSGTVDYRFTRKWSLRMEAGTTGGALDLLWQHRY